MPGYKFTLTQKRTMISHDKIISILYHKPDFAISRNPFGDIT